MDDGMPYLTIVGENGTQSFELNLLPTGNDGSTQTFITLPEGFQVEDGGLIVVAQEEEVSTENLSGGLDSIISSDNTSTPIDHHDNSDDGIESDHSDFETRPAKEVDEILDESDCEIVDELSTGGESAEFPSINQILGKRKSIVQKTSSRTTKRAHKALSISDKVSILQRLKKKEVATDLAREYGVGKSTITDIKRNEAKIIAAAGKLAKQKGNSETKTVRDVKNPKLEDALHRWFLQCRSLGNPVSGPILKAKAEIFYEQLGGPTVKFSDGWLGKFKRRHGIRQLNIVGERMDSDLEAASKFKKELASIITDGGYTLDMLYNADETGLYWKALPDKTLVSGEEKLAPGFEMKKDRVTLMTTANASGTVKLPLVLIGKSENPHSFRGIDKRQLPVHYYHQKRCWMNAKNFENWFFKRFVPFVRERHREMNIEEKALLLLDNAPVHPNVETLTTPDGKIKALFLPPNVTSTHQPMDQGVIETMKRHYRKELLLRLLCRNDEELGTLKIFWQELKILEAVRMAANAWDKVESRTLKRAWNKLLDNRESSTGSEESLSNVIETVPTVPDLLSVSQSVPGFQDFEEGHIENWLQLDKEDTGFEILNDEDFLADDEGDGDDDEPVPDTPTPLPSINDALNAADLLISYVGGQNDVNSSELLLLKNVREGIALRKVTNLKQPSISQFFHKR